jgi:hypothetical protein
VREIVTLQKFSLTLGGWIVYVEYVIVNELMDGKFHISSLLGEIELYK